MKVQIGDLLGSLEVRMGIVRTIIIIIIIGENEEALMAERIGVTEVIKAVGNGIIGEIVPLHKVLHLVRILRETATTDMDVLANNPGRVKEAPALVKAVMEVRVTDATIEADREVPGTETPLLDMQAEMLMEITVQGEAEAAADLGILVLADFQDVMAVEALAGVRAAGHKIVLQAQE